MKTTKIRATAQFTLKGTKVQVIKRSEVKQVYRYTVQMQNDDGSWFDRLSCDDWNTAVSYAESFIGTIGRRIVDNSEELA